MAQTAAFFARYTLGSSFGTTEKWREKTAVFFRAHLGALVTFARSDVHPSFRRYCLQSLKNSLLAFRDEQAGFETIVPTVGLYLGKEFCREIGRGVCQDFGFTLQEADELLATLPSPWL